MAEQTANVESREDFAEPKLVQQWLAEIKAYDKTYNSWAKQCRAIIKRYRNETADDGLNDGMMLSRPEFNVLWSNTQTVAPIIYSRVPKASISRRWKDRNVVGRCAAIILERATQSQIDDGGFDAAMTGARDDYLLTARGQMWARYVPVYGEETKDKTYLQQGQSEDGSMSYSRMGGDSEDEPVDLEEGQQPQQDKDGRYYIEEGDPYKPVVSESISIEHIPWDRFGHTPAPCWGKVRGVWKGEPMTREQMRERFGEEKADKVELKLKVPGIAEETIANFGDVFKRALVYEVWDKTTGKVLWITEGLNEPLDVKDDPLGLKDFFPCPPPVFGTTTTDSLIPVPEYNQYKAQAEQIDELTIRISLLVEAVRVVGLYDGQAGDSIQLLLSRQAENKLIPVDNWAMFAEKGGIRGAIDWLPIEQIVAAIQTLQAARAQLLDDIFQIIGLSDIIRGQASEAGQAATATEQRIKGQYAGLRISDRQLKIEKFARSGVQIVAEIAAEHFLPETLWEVSGWEYSDEAAAIDKEYAEWEAAAQQAQAEFEQAQQEYIQAMQSGMVGSPTPMPTGGDGGEAAPQSPPTPPEPPQIPPPPPTSKEVFAQAVQLLQDEKARGFAIDIETDSMVLEDQQQEAQNRTDLLEKVTGYLTQAVPASEQYPALAPLLGEFLLWTMRGHKIGRTMEASVEQAWDSLINPDDQGEDTAGEDAANQQALEIEGAKVQVAQTQAETARAKAEADVGLRTQKQQSDEALAAMKMQMDQAKAERDAAIEEAKVQAQAAKDNTDRILKMLELRLKGEEVAVAKQRNTVDAVIGAAQVDAQADAAQRAAEAKRMQGGAE